MQHKCCLLMICLHLMEPNSCWGVLWIFKFLSHSFFLFSGVGESNGRRSSTYSSWGAGLPTALWSSSSRTWMSGTSMPLSSFKSKIWSYTGSPSSSRWRRSWRFRRHNSRRTSKSAFKTGASWLSWFFRCPFSLSNSQTVQQEQRLSLL